MALFSKSGKKTDFYGLLIEHSKKVYEAYHIMYKAMDENKLEDFEKIFFLERDADDLRRILIEKLNKTLITPFDREDVFSLSRSVDDIIDAAKSTVEEIKVFKVGITEDLKEMISILERGTLEIHDSLKSLKNYPEVALEHAKRAKATENEMNHLYLKSIADIFDNKDNTPGYMMKMREIYRHLNRSADQCDEAANIISDIIIKTS